MNDINRDHIVRRRTQAAAAELACRDAIEAKLCQRNVSISDWTTIARDAAEAATHGAQVEAFDASLAALDADRLSRPGIQIGHGNQQFNTFGGP